MSKKHPNLIFLFADQLNYQSCGFSGESRAKTPNLDRLASEGSNFSQAVSCSPLCGPYRASLFTGKYPSSTGCYRNDLRCKPDKEAVGHQLEKAGYQTGYIGKWHLYGGSKEQQTPPGPHRLGFDQYYASYNWNHDYWNGFYYLDDEERHPMKGYQTDFQTDMALDFIENKKDDPFALFVSYEVPHPPCTKKDVPEKYYDLFKDVDFSDLLYNQNEVFEEFTPSFDKAWQKENVIDQHNERCRVYYAMTACLDDNIGRIMQALDEKGLAEETIIVFTSDHGDMLGGHGRISKRIFFEESVRVPLLLRWKDQLVSRTQNDVCINTPDIMPTLLDLMNLDIPKGYEGTSYGPLLLGQTQAEFPDHAFITNMQGGKFNHEEEYRAIRTPQYLYARMVRTGKEYLFDHQHDPKEEKNHAGEAHHLEELQHFRSVLNKKMDDLGDRAHPAEWYENNWIEGRQIKMPAIT